MDPVTLPKEEPVVVSGLSDLADRYNAASTPTVPDATPVSLMGDLRARFGEEGKRAQRYASSYQPRADLFEVRTSNPSAVKADIKRRSEDLDLTVTVNGQPRLKGESELTDYQKSFLQPGGEIREKDNYLSYLEAMSTYLESHHVE